MFNIFYLAGIVESVGSGMGRILSSLKAQKLPEPKSRDEMMMEINIKDRKHFLQTYLNPLIKTGKIKRTIPDKPSSKNQKYVTIV